jgi:ABC-type Co2+ transport system permease subunit
MLSHVVEQVAILAVAIVLLGVPGAALAYLLRLRAALPDSLEVPAAALLGSLVACVATAVQLATSSPAWVAMTTHGVLSVLLVAAALLVRRRRGAVVPVA